MAVNGGTKDQSFDLAEFVQMLKDMEKEEEEKKILDRVEELEENVEERDLEIKRLLLNLQEKEIQIRRVEEKANWYWDKIELLMSLMKKENGNEKEEDLDPVEEDDNNSEEEHVSHVIHQQKETDKTKGKRKKV